MMICSGLKELLMEERVVRTVAKAMTASHRSRDNNSNGSNDISRDNIGNRRRRKRKKEGRGKKMMLMVVVLSLRMEAKRKKKT